MKRNQYTFS